MNERDQPPLFDWPVPMPKPPKMAARPGKPTYAKCHPKVRTMCDECTADIHRRGVHVAPFPRVVRWRRRDGEHTLLLCELHKQVWTERDG